MTDFKPVTLQKGDSVKVADNPATLTNLKWNGYVESDKSAKSASESAEATKAKAKSTTTTK